MSGPSRSLIPNISKSDRRSVLSIARKTARPIRPKPFMKIFVFISFRSCQTVFTGAYSAAHEAGGMFRPLWARCNSFGFKLFAKIRPLSVNRPSLHKYPANIATLRSSLVPTLCRRRKKRNIRSCSQKSSTTLIFNSFSIIQID